MSTRPSRSPVFGALALVLAMLATPLGWRATLARWGPAPTGALGTYLPAIQPPRAREPFDAGPIESLQSMKPTYVVIGDSMVGRIEPAYFTHLSDQNIALIFENATGPSHWFLVLKNYVVASGITPKQVIVFFRDTNLTDPLWRLSVDKLDPVALDREDELNAVVAARAQGAWFRVHALLDRTYGVERARSWVEPAMTTWLARIVVGKRRHRAFLDEMNAMFALDALRPMAAADIAAAEDQDTTFPSLVTTSLLPDFLRLAKAHDLHVCFLRVLRRPVDNRPPEESARLTRYIRDLRQYLESNGAALLDDRDEPELATLPYNDGDHIAREAKPRYTELFYARLLKLGQ